MYGNIDRIQEAVSPILMRLLEGTKEKKNYIFGTGWMGTKFWDVCTKMNFQFDGFIVTRKTSSTYHGIPVYSLDECTYIMKHATVFVTLRDQEPALLQKLAELFSVVVPITYPRDLTLVEAKFFIDYLKKLGVSCCQDWIMMNGYRFPNPFLKPDDYLLSWAYEAGDLLLPALYDDEVRVDEGPYELGMVALSDGDVVIDAGANIGLFTCYALQKNCRVYAFEPLKLAIEYLQEIQSEFKQRLTICPSALAEKNSTAVFHVQNYDLLGASLHYNHNSVDVEYEVRLQTIDHAVKEYGIQRVDFIKADIEGSERDMLKGAETTIKRWLPKIAICTYHLQDDKEVLESIIKGYSSDYVVTHKWKKLFAYVPEEKRNLGGKIGD